MKRNVDLFLAIADHIEKNPEQHAQGVWIAIGSEVPGGCGTAACIAGWAVLLAKPEWLTPPPEDGPGDWYELSLDHAAIEEDEPNLYASWDDVGSHVLGLCDFETAVLFAGGAMPRHHVDGWPDALRRIAAGAEIDDVIQR